MTVPRMYPKQEAPKGLMDRAEIAKLARGRMMVRGSVALNLAHDVQAHILDGRDPCGAQKLYLEALWEKEAYEQFVGHIKTFRHDQDALKAYEGIARGFWGHDRRDQLVREKMELFEHGASDQGPTFGIKNASYYRGGVRVTPDQASQSQSGSLDRWLTASGISFEKPGQHEAAKGCLEAYINRYGPTT